MGTQPSTNQEIMSYRLDKVEEAIVEWRNVAKEIAALASVLKETATVTDLRVKRLEDVTQDQTKTLSGLKTKIATWGGALVVVGFLLQNVIVPMVQSAFTSAKEPVAHYQP